MIKKLLILGAGGAGKEVADIAISIMQSEEVEWELSGFLDDNYKSIINNSLPAPILGAIGNWNIEDEQVFVCSVGNPNLRAKIIANFSKKGAEFINLIHPLSMLSPSARIGSGCVIYPYTYVSSDVTIGNHVLLNLHGAVGHDAKIGDFSVVSSYCDITGNVSVGERVFMGSHVCIAPGLEIGDEAVLGIGSVVVSKVQAGKKVFGNPARSLEL